MVEEADVDLRLPQGVAKLDWKRQGCGGAWWWRRRSWWREEREWGLGTERAELACSGYGMGVCCMCRGKECIEQQDVGWLLQLGEWRRSSVIVSNQRSKTPPSGTTINNIPHHDFLSLKATGKA